MGRGLGLVPEGGGDGWLMRWCGRARMEGRWLMQWCGRDKMRGGGFEVDKVEDETAKIEMFNGETSTNYG